MRDRSTVVLLGIVAVILAGGIGALSWLQQRARAPAGTTRPMVRGEIQPAERNPFRIVRVTVEPRTPQAGTGVTITAEVQSRVAPHSRADVVFLVDQQVVDRFSEVIPPFQIGISKAEWTATPGPHLIRVSVRSPADVEYASAEQQIVVRPQ
jgi:hypothetical protein